MGTKLTATAAKALVAKGKPARHADGGNVYLVVTAPGTGKWTYRYSRAGKAHELGLGTFCPDGRNGVSLAQARIAAEEPRRLLREGLDPINHRKTVERQKAADMAQARTFQDVADMLISAHEAGWRNRTHRHQWRQTLETYAFPILGTMPVADISTDDVLKVLQRDNLWITRPETASRLRGRIEAVLSYAGARGWRAPSNPAAWRGHLASLLPPRTKIAAVRHHPALAWQDIAQFVGELRKHDATTARALEFLILTASRTGEVLGAKWSEIDLEAVIWTVPAGRMKASRQHRVPLSTSAVAVLQKMLPINEHNRDTFIFPGLKADRPLSQMSMAMLLRRMKRNTVTVHGFRSSFRDWCEEATSTPRAVAEAALAHSISDKVEAAYRRGDLFQKRVTLMQAWADFCNTKPAQIFVLIPERVPA